MPEAPFIKRFLIKGLHYYRDFELKFDSDIIILVGENGLGKTTILNALAHVLQREWTLLSGIGFDLIQIEFVNDIHFEFTHSELDVFVLSEITSRPFDVPMAEQVIVDSTGKSVVEVKNKFSKIAEVIIKLTRTYPVVLFPAIRALRNDLINFIGDEYLRESDKFKTIEEKFQTLDVMPESLEYLKEAADKAKNSDWIGMFINKCNEYLVNTRLVRTRNNDFFIENKISGEKLSLVQLSSGEQQLVFIFSKIFLTTQRNLCVLFDEPEMSLSLSWQRKILVDIVNSKRCSLLFVITHSPFTFDNELVTYAKGINTCLKSAYGVD